MPELPEVEAARCLIESHCVDNRITQAVTLEAGGHARDGEFDNIVFDDKELSASDAQNALQGKTVKAVHRRGKQLWLELSSPPHLLAHFGMTGAFVVKGVAPLAYQEFTVHDEVWPPRFTKLELVFGSSTRLAFCDPRRLGRLRLRDDPINQDPWRALAPDPHLAPISVATALKILGATAKPIKALLLDQAALVSGVGNWMADEILFQAGIHPEASCSSLSEAQVGQLHASLLHVVTTAVGALADSAKFPKEWLFHYRWGKGKAGTSVPGAAGGHITFITVGGRTSAVVLSRQRKGEGRAAEAATAHKKPRAPKPAKAVEEEEPPTAEKAAAKKAQARAADTATSEAERPRSKRARQ